MKVLILGIDGYLGWPLALHLLDREHEVQGVDNGSRRQLVLQANSLSATPIPTGEERAGYLISTYPRQFLGWTNWWVGSSRVDSLLAQYQPDCIVHLAEQPSAPYSMSGPLQAIETQTNNVLGTLQLLWSIAEHCPQAHLVKLGTMGEYGTPQSEIPEGVFPPSSRWVLKGHVRGNLGGLPFPRKAGSFYHLSKVHDTHNIMFACENWGLRSTDIMQGVVYGTRTDEITDPKLATRFDFDQTFGTAINRFCAQAVIGYPLTVYGEGEQRRGFLPLRDSIACMTIAVERPPEPGEYRTWNQLEEVYSINQLAERVVNTAKVQGLKTRIQRIDNPRHEQERHDYAPHVSTLRQLGYQPTTDMAAELQGILEDLTPHRTRIETAREQIKPTIRWASPRPGRNA